MVISSSNGTLQDSEVLEFDYGVRVYPPAAANGYWRLRWIEDGHRRDTTAASHDEALAKATDVVAGLSRGRPTDWARAPGSALVDHYLNPARPPTRGRSWSRTWKLAEPPYGHTG